MTITVRAKEEEVVRYFQVLLHDLLGCTKSSHKRTTG
jgi:hypothetical protein